MGELDIERCFFFSFFFFKCYKLTSDLDHFAVGLNLNGTRRNGKVRGGIKLGCILHLDRGLDQLSGSGDVV